MFAAAISQLAVAWTLGLGEEADALGAALVIPGLLIAETTGVLSASIVPWYWASVRNLGRRSTERMLGRFHGAILIIAIAVTIAVAPITDPLIGILAPSVPADLGQALLLLLLPSIAPAVGLAVASSYRFARSQYAYPLLLQGLPALGMAVFGPIFEALQMSPAIGFAAGRTLGYLSAYGLILIQTPHPVRPRLRRLDITAMNPLTGTGPMWMANIASLLIPAIERRYANALGVGAVAAYAIIAQILGAGNSLILQGFSVVSGTDFAKMRNVERARRSELTKRALVAAALGFVAAIAIGISVRLFGQTVLVRGSFTIGDLELLVDAITPYSLALVPMASGAIIGRWYYAWRNYTWPSIISVISLAIYMPLAWWTSARYGATGLSSSAVIFWLIPPASLYILSRRQIRVDNHE